jgi:hypothetical protein
VADNPGIAVILCSTHDPKDLPADAVASGAIAYVSRRVAAPKSGCCQAKRTGLTPA